MPRGSLPSARSLHHFIAKVTISFNFLIVSIFILAASIYYRSGRVDASPTCIRIAFCFGEMIITAAAFWRAA